MSTFAIVESGNQQLLVHENDILKVEKLDTGKKKEITLDRVLLLKKDKAAKVGNPLVSGAKVNCEVLGEERQNKVITFQFRKRKDSRRIVGSRQTLTLLKVKSIQG